MVSQTVSLKRIVSFFFFAESPITNA